MSAGEVDDDIEGDDEIEIVEAPELEELKVADERRRTARVPIKLTIRFGTNDEFARSIRAYTHNIGLEGVCILTRRSYEPGQQLNLAIATSDGRPLALVGVVTWRKEGVAIGIRFERLDAEARGALEALLSPKRLA